MVMTANGVLLPEGHRQEACPNCRPELFHDNFSDPTDRRIWPEQLAKPYLYERAADGTWRAKDILLADLDDAWNKDPDAEARDKWVEHKRKTRRTKPLEAWEIEQAERAWRPIVKQMYAEQEQAQKADLEYTESRIEHWRKLEHDSTVQ